MLSIVLLEELNSPPQFLPRVGQHVSVNSFNNFSYPVFQVIDIPDWCFEYSVFNVAPEKEVEGRQVRTPGWPGDWAASPYPLARETLIKKPSDV